MRSINIRQYFKQTFKVFWAKRQIISEIRLQKSLQLCKMVGFRQQPERVCLDLFFSCCCCKLRINLIHRASYLSTYRQHIQGEPYFLKKQYSEHISREGTYLRIYDILDWEWIGKALMWLSCMLLMSSNTINKSCHFIARLKCAPSSNLII